MHKKVGKTTSYPLDRLVTGVKGATLGKYVLD